MMIASARRPMVGSYGTEPGEEYGFELLDQMWVVIEAN
jgi:hypothetical protein